MGFGPKVNGSLTKRNQTRKKWLLWDTSSTSWLHVACVTTKHDKIYTNTNSGKLLTYSNNNHEIANRQEYVLIFCLSLNNSG